jgi:hypothetical protein
MRILGETSSLPRIRVDGAEVDPIAENERKRYLHFCAPVGELYELVERMGDKSDAGRTPEVNG